MKSLVGESNCGSMKLFLPSHFSRLHLVSNFNTGIEELPVVCTTQLLRRGTQILGQFYESLVVN